MIFKQNLPIGFVRNIFLGQDYDLSLFVELFLPRLDDRTAVAVGDRIHLNSSLLIVVLILNLQNQRARIVEAVLLGDKARIVETEIFSQ